MAAPSASGPGSPWGGSSRRGSALTVPKRGLLVSEGEEVDWDRLFPPGFRPLPRRWVIERTFSWIIRWRRLCRDHEGLPTSIEALIRIATCSRMLNLLTPTYFSY